MSATPLGTRSLKLKIGSTEYNADVSNCTIEAAAADSDFTSFAAAASGGARQYKLKFTATQDPADATSIWNKIWTAAGTTVAVSVNPYGGTTFSATNPGFTCNAVISEPDGTILGGGADSSTTAKFTIDVEWDLTAKPTLVTTGSY
ncbi:hypothetical protein [Nocardioides nematodiphilus]|uniref:hypothetical protein n=1 Tax=Nocardioides nematodiphilus TaxID=2849669 RepID=UPI001CDA36A3|nr:hypothetical protein [Nocardioides nematodiphilus]MCA1984796.1 hypothetical protein [Nocardioides nematodiphilus]